MWFSAKRKASKSRLISSPSRRQQQPADRRRESRRLLLESLEERRVLTFLPAVDYVVGDDPQAIVAGDFNRDSRTDLAVVNTGSNTVSLLLGNADGTFASGGSFAVGTGPVSIAAGDFNKDGNLDLVTANNGSQGLSVLLGNGSAGFAAATSVPLPGVRSVAVGDFNGDGTLDLGIGKRASEYVPPWSGGGYYGSYGGGGYYMNYEWASVLLGSGNGTFGSERSFLTASGITYNGPDVSPLPVAMADLNGDGKADLVARSYYFRIFLGNANSTLQSPGSTNLSGSSLAIVDLNGDAKLDLATTGGNSVSVALGNGQGAFGSATHFEAGASPSFVTSADVNSDGRADLVVVSSQTSGVNVLLGRSGGGLQFTPPIAASTGASWTSLLSKDFNGDGRPDIAAVTPGADAVSVLLNDGTWLDPSAPSLRISDVSITEGNSGTVNATFTVTLSAPSNLPVTFHYATGDYINSRATAGVDYVAQSGDITIPAGQTSAVIQVAVIGDRLGESTKYFVVNLSNPTNAFIADAQGTGTILDDEPVLSMAEIYVSSFEGNTGTTPMNFVVRLSAASDAEVRINYSTVEGDTGWWTGGGYYGGSSYYAPATADSDFQPAEGTLIFAPGEVEKTITIRLIGDRIGGEGSEYFFVNLSNPLGASLTYGQSVGIILDDEPLAYLSNYPIATEGNTGTSPMTFSVALSQPYDVPVTVSFTTSDGTALAGSDYVATTGSVTFNPGQTSQSIVVPILGDMVAENDEYFRVNLTAATNANFSLGSAYAYIIDDDMPPTISISDASVVEGNSGSKVMSFTVSLSNPWAQGISVKFATVNGTAKASDNDYVAQSGSLYFAPGQTTQTIQIVIKGDTRKEQNETFTVKLSGAQGASISDGQGTGVILNDDGGGKPVGSGKNKLTVFSAAAVDSVLTDLLALSSKKRRR